MIRDLRVYSVYNSKGKHSLKVKIKTSNGFYSASVPSGTSKGKNEAKDVPIEKVMEVLPHIKKNVIGLDETDWITVDKIIEQTDPSGDYSKMGISLALGISLAVARASEMGELWKFRGTRSSYGFPLPLGNVIGGGEHGGSPAWQEFLVLPHKAKTPREATETNYEIWKVVGEELKKRKWLQGRNMENAWMSTLDDLKTLDLLSSIAEDYDVKLGIDFAASEFWKGGKYAYKSLGKNLTREKQMDAVERVAEVYNLYYLEDPLHENDFEGFAEIRKRLPGKLIVGDDLYCTNTERIKRGISMGSTNAAIIKPNQFGTLFQVGNALRAVRNKGMTPVISHRSGETEDNWLSDLALAWSCPMIKIGNYGPDIPKHSRLIELWEDVPSPTMAELPK